MAIQRSTDNQGSSEGIRAFEFHGVHLTACGSQMLACCPFCDKRKFYVDPNNGKWDCKVCGLSGNSMTFLRKLYEESLAINCDSSLSRLASDKKLLGIEGLKAWGVVQSLMGDSYLIPGYSSEGKIVQIYRYLKEAPSGINKVTPTPGLDPARERHGMLGINLFKSDKAEAYICEGIWDGVSLWEAIRCANLGKRINVLAVPGANVFFSTWLDMFHKKKVSLFFDNDHPRKQARSKRVITGAGLNGLIRTTKLLTGAVKPPASIHYLKWGELHYNPSLPDGMDVRDAITNGSNSKNPNNGDQRVTCLAYLMDMVEPVPEDWLSAAAKAPGCYTQNGSQSDSKDSSRIASLPCRDWKVLTDSWSKALTWTRGLDLGLSVSLASIVSIPTIGDQLWIRMMGPPSSGKTTLCEALEVSRYTLSASMMTGFHSGYKSDREGIEDHSLVAKLRGKMLITKDGDVLLRSAYKDQILAEARDIYDTTARAFYRHGVSRDYSGIRIVWLLCGTGSLRQLDSSELGERFISVIVANEMDEDQEDDIAYRVSLMASDNLRAESNCRAESRHDPRIAEARALTGGYVDYLYENGQRLLKNISMGEETRRRIAKLGRFVAYMRARSSLKQDEVVQRELSFRLVSQYTRLAECLAVVMGKAVVDDEIMGRVNQVAMDTSAGRTLDIVQTLHKAIKRKRVGINTSELAVWVNWDRKKTKPYMMFLRTIGIVRVVERGRGSTPVWTLTDRMARLYDAVIEGTNVL